MEKGVREIGGPEVNTNPKKKTWKLMTITLSVLVLLLVVLTLNGGITSFATTGKVVAIPQQEAATKIIGYLNSLVGGGVELMGVEDLGNIYEVSVKYQGQIIPTYITKDGKYYVSAIQELEAVTENVDATAGEKVEINTEGAPSIGPENAKVTVIEFSDYQCPYCGAAAGTHEQLINQFQTRDPTWKPAVPELEALAKEGTIRYVFKNYPLGFHENAEKAAEAGLCAEEEGKFWEYHDLLYKNQEALTVTDLKKYATQIGINKQKFDECLDSGRMKTRVEEDMSDGTKAGVSGTPTYFINGIVMEGAVSFEDIKKVIEAEQNA